MNWQWQRAAKLAFATALSVGGAWIGCTGNPNPEVNVTGVGSSGSNTTTSSGTTGAGGGMNQCPGGKLCGLTCTNPDFDPQNCGDCGKACQMGEVCSMGQCGVSCLGGSTKCGDTCTNTDNDPKNCGMCGMACESSKVCVGGKCALTCESGGAKECNGICVDTLKDVKNCGGCDKPCDTGMVCSGGMCALECSGGTQKCNTGCVDVNNDPNNCGKCDNKCDVAGGEVCSAGLCTFSCIGGTIKCNGVCVDTMVDPKNCGSCNTMQMPSACKADEVCSAGKCAGVCGGALKKCGNFCLDVSADPKNCGACGTICKNIEKCVAGKCTVCDSTVTDCDGDGWKQADGDCCDAPGSCGANPALVNPGAVEVVGNGIDDNCNGKQDFFDIPDTAACDAQLGSNSSTATDYAKALGICRTTTANPALNLKTWGLIEAQLLRADGTALPVSSTQRSIRNVLGQVNPPNTEGQKAVILSTGIASDSSQTNPGPNSNAPGAGLGSSVDISTCNNALCIKDWFTTANAPLKNANELPVAPNCGKGNAGTPTKANDSVMLELKMRAPTNAKAFSLNTYFLSHEFPFYVCSDYNDQFVVLVDTPKPTLPVPNPIDKNLMIFSDGKATYPIGINLASATSLFNVCDLAAAQAQNNKISAKSCSLGAGQLSGTNQEGHGGSFWLTTAGNIIPGDTVTLRIVVWDVSDNVYDSTAMVDGFKWLYDATVPGTDDN
jgi:hypothetical protein